MHDRFRTAALGMAFCCIPALALSADFDGSKPLICATEEVHDCVAGEACQRGLPQSIGVPQFMRIDFNKKTIAGPYRTTVIASLIKSEQQLLLQGNELDYGWTVAIDTRDGSMAASLVGGDGVIAVFGACTPL